MAINATLPFTSHEIVTTLGNDINKPKIVNEYPITINGTTI